MRGEVQQIPKFFSILFLFDFNSRTAWGSSTWTFGSWSYTVQFQFPYCVGKFNPESTYSSTCCQHFNSRTAWGSSTSIKLLTQKSLYISIPVLRGEVQRHGKGNLLSLQISIPVLRGEVQPRLPVFTRQFVCEFQFPYCVGKFNIKYTMRRPPKSNFNSRTAWGSSTASICNARFIYLSEHVFADRL